MSRAIETGCIAAKYRNSQPPQALAELLQARARVASEDIPV